MALAVQPDQWRADLKPSVRTLSSKLWALGSCMICGEVEHEDNIPKDALANWKDDAQKVFYVRSRPDDLHEEGAPVKPLTANSSMAVFRIGQGVLLKAKLLIFAGSDKEGFALTLLHDYTPSVPAPEPLHHWKDQHWSCSFVIMREMHGARLDQAWFSLLEEHRDRLAKETARIFSKVADIGSPLATFADGEALNDGHWISEPNLGPFTAKGLYKYMTKTQTKVPKPSYYFHLCHCDLVPDHFFVSDGLPLPPPDAETHLVQVPVERQANLRISGIIDWEMAAFLPKWMATKQFWNHAGGLPWKMAGVDKSRHDEFHRAVILELVKMGFDDPYKEEFTWNSLPRAPRVPIDQIRTMFLEDQSSTVWFEWPKLSKSQNLDKGH